MTAPCFRFRLQQYNRHLKSEGNDYFLLAFSTRFSDIAREKLIELQFRRGRELQQRPGQAELLSKIAKELEIYQGSRKNEFQKKYADLLKSHN